MSFHCFRFHPSPPAFIWITDFICHFYFLLKIFQSLFSLNFSKDSVFFKNFSSFSYFNIFFAWLNFLVVTLLFHIHVVSVLNKIPWNPKEFNKNIKESWNTIISFPHTTMIPSLVNAVRERLILSKATKNQFACYISNAIFILFLHLF